MTRNCEVRVPAASQQDLRGALRYATLMHQLLTGGGSLDDLVSHTHLSINTVHRYIKALRNFPDSQGRRHCAIVEWQEDNRGYRTIPVFKLHAVPRFDTERPVLSGALKSRRYRERKINRRSIPNSVFDFAQKMVRNDQAVSDSTHSNQKDISVEQCEAS